VTESTDTYDTIDWLMKNVQYYGRNGDERDFLSGLSRDDGMGNPHPALKAVSEQACMAIRGSATIFSQWGVSPQLRLEYTADCPRLRTRILTFRSNSFDDIRLYLRLGALRMPTPNIFTKDST